MSKMCCLFVVTIFNIITYFFVSVIATILYAGPKGMYIMYIIMLCLININFNNSSNNITSLTILLCFISRI